MPGQHLLLVEDLLLELGAKENVIATWDLRRRDQAELKRSVQPTVSVGSSTGKTDRVCISFFFIYFESWIECQFLFQAGSLRANSRPVQTRRVSLLSLYISHQFTFYTLSEGYRALLQLYQLDIAGAKIEVQRTIEISPYTSGGDNATFIEGFSSPHNVRQVSSLFDQPIACAISAISGSLDSLNLPAILPQRHPEIQPPLTGLLPMPALL